MVATIGEAYSLGWKVRVHCASGIVGELMRHLGYVDDGQGKLPVGCVAKTALKWKPARRLA